MRQSVNRLWIKYLVVLTFLLSGSLTGHAQADVTPPVPSPAASQLHDVPVKEELKVLFQGGDVSENIGKILLALHERGALKLKRCAAKEGESLSSIYVDKLGIPTLSASLADLNKRLNSALGLSPDATLGKEVEVICPDVNVEGKTVAEELAPSSRKGLARLSYFKRIFGQNLKLFNISADQVKVEANVYELETDIPSTSAGGVLETIANLSNMNVKLLTKHAMLPTTPRTDFTLNIEGTDNLASEAAMILETLLDLKLVPLQKHIVAKGESLSSIYRAQLGVPVARKTIEIATKLNADLPLDILNVGDQVVVPQVQFTKYIWTQRFNPIFDKDQQRLAVIRKDWADLIEEIVPVSPSEVEVKLAGYRIKIDAGTTEKLEEAKHAFKKLGSDNIFTLFPNSDHLKRGYAAKAEDTQEVPWDGNLFWKKISEPNPKVPLGRQWTVGSYINLPTLDRKEVERCGLLDQCAELVLLDQAVEETHPDLASAMEVEKEASPSIIPPPVADDNTQILKAREFNIATDHGTHLAGIIASQDNKYGLIGINPYTTLKSLNWATLGGQPGELYAELNKRLQREKYQIFVYANRWTLDLNSDQQQNDEGEPLSNSNERDNDQIAAFIGRNTSLWVVSAGDDNKDLTWSFKEFTPMNLGDKRNVIVVTACEDCYGETARLALNASYSTNTISFVHIAAPYGPIPSTISSNGYAAAPGTSQSTALVAGVVSLMFDKWSSAYLKDSALMKTWLQLTSKPFPKLGEAHRANLGILDADKALKNPHKSYLQKKDEAGLLEFKPVAWAADILKVRSLKNDDPTNVIQTGDIRRIINRGNDWIVYTTYKPHDGKVFRIGPFTVTPAEAAKPLLRTSGGMLSLSDISDLLLATNL